MECREVSFTDASSILDLPIYDIGVQGGSENCSQLTRDSRQHYYLRAHVSRLPTLIFPESSPRDELAVNMESKSTRRRASLRCLQ